MPSLACHYCGAVALHEDKAIVSGEDAARVLPVCYDCQCALRACSSSEVDERLKHITSRLKVQIAAIQKCDAPYFKKWTDELKTRAGVLSRVANPTITKPKPIKVR